MMAVVSYAKYCSAPIEQQTAGTGNETNGYERAGEVLTHTSCRFFDPRAKVTFSDPFTEVPVTLSFTIVTFGLFVLFIALLSSSVLFLEVMFL